MKLMKPPKKKKGRKEQREYLARGGLSTWRYHQERDEAHETTKEEKEKVRMKSSQREFVYLASSSGKG